MTYLFMATTKRSGSAKKPKNSASKGKSTTVPTSATPNRKSTPADTQAKDKRMKLLKTIAIWAGVFLITLIVVDYGVQYLNYRASVAIVNGTRIKKGEYYEYLSDSYGSTVVGQMIDEELIYQEAAAKGVEVTDDEIDAEIKDLEDNYGGSDELQKELDARNISEEKLREQIQTTLLVEKMLEDKIEITEDEMKEFYEEYKDVLFPEDEDPTYEEAEDKIAETLRDQKISQEVQTWLAELRADATIKNNVDEPKNIEFLGITRTFIAELGN